MAILASRGQYLSLSFASGQWEHNVRHRRGLLNSNQIIPMLMSVLWMLAHNIELLILTNCILLLLVFVIL